MEKKGCQVALVIIGSLTGIGLIATTLPFLFNNQPQQQGATEVLRVGDTRITDQDLQLLVDRAQQQRSQMMSQQGMAAVSVDAIDLANIRATSLAQAVEKAIMGQIAKERGVSVNDEAFFKILEEEIKKRPQQLQAEKARLVSSGVLKADATDQQVIEALNQSGRPWPTDEELRTGMQRQINDPSTRPELLDLTQGQLILQSFAKGINKTEEDLKKTFDVFFINELQIDDAKASPADKRKRLEGALAEIKGGKKFEDVRKAINPKANNQPTKVSRGLLQFRKELEPIIAQQPGSDPVIVDVFGTPTLMQFVRSGQELPPDFEANKPMLLEQLKQQEAVKKIDEEIKARRAKVEWKIPAFEVLYRVVLSQDSEAMAAGPEKATQQLQAVVTDSQKMLADPKTDGFSQIVLNQARFLATYTLFQMSQGEEQVKLFPGLLESSRQILQFGESLRLRSQLVAFAIQQKNQEVVSEHLGALIRNNGDFSQNGQGIYTMASQYLTQAKEQKLVTPEQATELQKDLDNWVKRKADADRQAAEVRKAQEEAAKRAEEEVRKAQEEAAKAGTGQATPSTPALPGAPSGGQAPAPALPGAAPSSPAPAAPSGQTGP